MKKYAKISVHKRPTLSTKAISTPQIEHEHFNSEIYSRLDRIII